MESFLSMLYSYLRCIGMISGICVPENNLIIFLFGIGELLTTSKRFILYYGLALFFLNQPHDYFFSSGSALIAFQITDTCT